MFYLACALLSVVAIINIAAGLEQSASHSTTVEQKCKAGGHVYALVNYRYACIDFV
jgi:hypothetical protein